MAQIKFEDGTIVNFNGTPTQKDIDEVAAQLNIKPKSVDATKNPLEFTKGVLKGVGTTIGSAVLAPTRVAEAAGTKSQAKASAHGLDTLSALDNVLSKAYMEIPASDTKKRENLREQIKQNRAAMATLSGGIPTSQTPLTGGIDEFLKPTNATQSLGYGAEKVAEFLLSAKSINNIKTAATNTISKSNAIPSALKPITKLVTRAGIEGGSAGLITGAQTGGDLKQVKNATMIGGVVSIGGDLLTAFARRIAPAAERANLRLTPTQKRDLGNKVNEVTDYIQNNNYPLTPQGRYDRAIQDYNNLESDLQKALSNAKDVGVKKEAALEALDALKSNLTTDTPDAMAIIRQIDDAKANIEFQYKTDLIPVDRLNALKRSTFQNAYNKAGNKVLDSVEHAIGDTYYTLLKDELEKAGVLINGQPLAAFNKEYQTVINAKKLLKIAASRNQVGFFGRLLSSYIGGGIGNEVAGLGGAATGTFIGGGIVNNLATPFRSLAGRAGTAIGSSPNLLTNTTRLGIGASNRPADR